MKSTFKTALFNTKELLPVAADVSKATSNYGRQDITSALESYRSIAPQWGSR